jgi:hypothetical protein
MKDFKFNIKVEEKDTDAAPCQNCGAVSTKSLHSCPYACEIHDDHNEEYCNCCSNCEEQCAMDI